MSRDVVNDVSRLLVALNDGGLNDHDETYSELVKSASRLVRDLSIPSSKHDVEDSNSDEDEGCGTDNLIGIFNVDAFDRDGTRTSFVEDAIRVDLAEIVTMELSCLVNSKESWHQHQRAVTEIVPPLPPARSSSSSSARVSSPRVQINGGTSSSSENRHRRYRDSLRKVLKTEKQFSAFLQREMGGISEGLFFLVRVDKYRSVCLRCGSSGEGNNTSGFEKCMEEARRLLNRYVDLDHIDTLEVLSDETRRVTRARLEEVRISRSAGVTETTEALRILVGLFDPACGEIERAAMKKAYPQYLEWKKRFAVSSAG
jgi:hypothetical protein